MRRMNYFTKAVVVLLVGAPLCVLAVCYAQPGQQFTEPVYRVARTPERSDAQQLLKDEQPQHPLDPALEVARKGLKTIRNDIRDYTATIVKSERIGGSRDAQHIYCKIRNRKVVDGKLVTPFSVYLKFLKPDNVKGREVIYVEGKNNGKMCAHEGGRAGKWLPTVWLAPDGAFAMRGQRYPLTDIGIENLILKLIEKGERDRQRGECDVKFYENAKINGRATMCIQVTHPVKRPHFDFNVARIFIDEQLNAPIRYAAYQWPEQEGGEPVLDEEYTYLNLKVNVGLTDADFDPHNKSYNFY